MTLSKEEVSKIVELYHKYNGNMNEIQRRFKSQTGYHISRYAIRTRLIESGLKLNPRGGKRVPLNKDNKEQVKTGLERKL
ncbi:MAG: hypothetical protein KJ559_02240 [Nanoarchaeota archaeon]|nr:hypothetical protein [Nanoarchaeota archaeon]